MIGGKQLEFSDCMLTTAQKQTKWEKSRAKMEAVVSWQALVEPFYPKSCKKGGSPPCSQVSMLWIHLFQQWLRSAASLGVV